MIIIRQVFFLRDRDRHKNRLSHCISLKCDVDREQFRNRLDHRFIDRIRNAISNRVTQSQRVGFSNKLISYPIRVPAGQEAKKAENQNQYYMPRFHSKIHPVITSGISASTPFSTYDIAATIRIIISLFSGYTGSSAGIPLLSATTLI